MATVKQTNGNLIIQTPFQSGVASNITLDTDYVYTTGNLYVTGNLVVRGGTTEVVSNITKITDNIITLNSGETGNGVSTLGSYSGLEIDRGTAPGGNVYLLWNETVYAWQISGVGDGNGAVGVNIATVTGGSALSSVVNDPNPVLGGNLNVQNKTIYANVAANTYVTIQGVLSIINANITPLTNAGTTVFYANAAGAGTAGLYVVNDQATNEELITKRRAFGFSLLL